MTIATGDEIMPEKVLVVDDEQCVRTMIATVLSKHGYDVLMAEDGLHGFNEFQAHAAAVGLVISDVMMPHQMGPDMVERILDIAPATKILFITGFARNVFEPLGLEHPYLQKPFNPAALLEAVDNLLQKPAK